MRLQGAMALPPAAMCSQTCMHVWFFFVGHFLAHACILMIIVC